MGAVDVLATLFAVFGWFRGYKNRVNIVGVVRIWIFSFGVFAIMGGLYYFMQGSTGFDNLMHGKSPKRNQKQRSLEDFGMYPPLFRSAPISTTMSQSSLSSVSRPSTRRPNRWLYTLS